MHERIKRLILIILVMVIVVLGFYFLNESFQSPEEVRDYIQGFGVYAPLVVIGIIILEVIVAPIPGYIIAIGAGYAFGPVYGTIYSYVGNVIGSGLAFLISRYFGRPVIKWLVKDEKLQFYDQFIRSKGVYGLWLFFLIPVFPVDIISFATGLSDLKFSRFMKIVLIAFIPNMIILNIIGDRIVYGLNTTNLILLTILGVILLLAVLHTFARRKGIIKENLMDTAAKRMQKTSGQVKDAGAQMKRKVSDSIKKINKSRKKP